ncbi:MAG: hypothetical protein FWH43_00330 [Endomicrobia bacterium]|nr:hypothetical protein [Endomicrobiia bacterium]
MKKIILSMLLIFFFAAASFSARQFLEGVDYEVSFKQNEDNNIAAILRINFVDLMPDPAEAEAVLKDQLKVYAQILETEKENLKKVKEELELEKEKNKKKNKPKPKEKGKSKEIQDIKNPDELKAFFEEEDAAEEKYKNIIGSVWFSPDETAENAEKIKYGDNSSAFVWIEKTKKIVPFPDYIKFLKKEKDERKQKEKERALMIRELSKNPQDIPAAEEEDLLP